MIKKITKNILKTVVFLLFIFGIHTTAVFAFGESFNIELIPSHPLPNETVKLKTKTFSFDLSRSNISWSLDGEVIKRGVGEREIETEMPSLGKTKSVSVFITTSDGTSLSKNIILSGNDIDLLIEPITYTPYWYKGSSLPTKQSEIKINAIPHIYSGSTKISNSNLNYDWFLGYKKDNNQSGFNRKTFSFSAKKSKDYVVNLKVSTLNNSVVFEKAIRVSSYKTKPRLIFYENHPLQGILYNNPLTGAFSFLKNSITITAEPFFFSPEENGLSWTWKLGGEEIIKNKDRKSIFLEKTGNDPTDTLLNLEVRNTLKILQSAKERLSISF